MRLHVDRTVLVGLHSITRRQWAESTEGLGECIMQLMICD